MYRVCGSVSRLGPQGDSRVAALSSVGEWRMLHARGPPPGAPGQPPCGPREIPGYETSGHAAARGARPSTARFLAVKYKFGLLKFRFKRIELLPRLATLFRW